VVPQKLLVSAISISCESALVAAVANALAIHLGDMPAVIRPADPLLNPHLPHFVERDLVGATVVKLVVRVPVLAT
jgi:hypothetical protein